MMFLQQPLQQLQSSLEQFQQRVSEVPKTICEEFAKGLSPSVVPELRTVARYPTAPVSHSIEGRVNEQASKSLSERALELRAGEIRDQGASAVLKEGEQLADCAEVLSRLKCYPDLKFLGNDNKTIFEGRKAEEHLSILYPTLMRKQVAEKILLKLVNAREEGERLSAEDIYQIARGEIKLHFKQRGYQLI